MPGDNNSLKKGNRWWTAVLLLRGTLSMKDTLWLLMAFNKKTKRKTPVVTSGNSKKVLIIKVQILKMIHLSITGGRKCPLSNYSVRLWWKFYVFFKSSCTQKSVSSLKMPWTGCSTPWDYIIACYLCMLTVCKLCLLCGRVYTSEEEAWWSTAN